MSGWVNNDLDTLLTALYVFLDHHVTGPRRIGWPPLLSDAELLCLAIAQVLLGFAGERHWVRYARKNLRHLFPYIPDQSGYGKRLRAAGPLIARVIRKLAEITTTGVPDPAADRLHTGALWHVPRDHETLRVGR